MPNFALHKIIDILVEHGTMSKVSLSVAFLLSVGLSAHALDYNEARQHAWYLTDKMAYELNLSAEQCDLVYEINLDYFLRLNNRYDIEGNYWNYRHTDLQYVLLDWQYSIYCNTSYFYTPVAWQSSSWHYPVYSYYQAEYYYFERPRVYTTYRGTTTPRGNNDMGHYYGRSVNYTRGMRDLYDAHIHIAYPHGYTTQPHSSAGYRYRYETRRHHTPMRQRSYTRPSTSNITRTQRDYLHSNTIPALRTDKQLHMDLSTPRVGRSSSTRVTVNMRHRDNEAASQPQFNRQTTSNTTRSKRSTR